MDKKQNLIRELRLFKNRLSKERKIEKMILFGSRSKKKHRKDSDVDLIVVSLSFKGIKCGRGKGLYKYWRLNYPVDFICYTPEEYRKKSKQISIVSEAIKNGIEIN